MSSSLVVWLLLLAALVVLPALYARDNARARRRRAGFFSDCLALLDGCRVTVTAQAYPRLEGRYRGHDVRLELVLDDMAWRKLPSLWLKATVFKPNPGRMVLDFMMRPQGQEFYSPSGDMTHRLPVPRSWPQNAILCADNAACAGHLEPLARHMALFDDPRAKELVVSPHGVRLVYQAAQAERAHYLVLRQARFAETRVAPALAGAMLDRAIAIATSLDRGFASAEPCAEAA
jgi:hypothetical protein